MLGFIVIKWGLTTHDAHLQTDIVPAGFQIERKLHLEHAHDPPRIIVEQPEPAHPERDAFVIKFQRPATAFNGCVPNKVSQYVGQDAIRWITFERKKWGQRSLLPSLSSISAQEPPLPNRANVWSPPLLGPP